MTAMLNEVWAELYWNTADWLPWIATQALFAAALAAVLQWWFKIGWPIVFGMTLVISLTLNFYRLPPSAISQADVAKMNEGLPRDFDGITLESVTFSHRVLEFRASSSDPRDADALKGSLSADSVLLAEQCKMFGKWLVSRQIKQIRHSWSWPGGTYSQSIEARDCSGGSSS